MTLAVLPTFCPHLIPAVWCSQHSEGCTRAGVLTTAIGTTSITVLISGCALICSMIPLPHAGAIFLCLSLHCWGSRACRYAVYLENKSPLEVCFLLSMRSLVYICCLGLTSVLLFFLTIKSPNRVSSEVPPVLCSMVKPLILLSRTARVPGGRAIKQLINERLIQH